MYTGYQSAVIKIGDSIITDIDDITEFCSEMCVDISNDETDNVEEVEEFSEFDLGYEIDLGNDDNVDPESIGLFSEFLNKNGYDKYSNTLLINGNRVDAGELNFKENRNKFNKIFEECQYDINNDTLVINSDKLKVSIDSIFPDELMSSSDLTAEQYLDSYIKAGELIEEQFSDDNFFTEGVFEAIGKGLKAIWDFIVKCIKFIGRQIARFFKFIKSLFTGNKEKSLVSAEQSLQESGANIDNKKTSEAVDFIKNPKSSKNVTIVSRKTDDVVVRVRSSSDQSNQSSNRSQNSPSNQSSNNSDDYWDQFQSSSKTQSSNRSQNSQSNQSSNKQLPNRSQNSQSNQSSNKQIPVNQNNARQIGVKERSTSMRKQNDENIPYEDIELILREFDYILDKAKGVVKCKSIIKPSFLGSYHEFRTAGHADSSGKRINNSTELSEIDKNANKKVRKITNAVCVLSGEQMLVGTKMMTWDDMYDELIDLCNIIDNITITKKTPADFRDILNRLSRFSNTDVGYSINKSSSAKEYTIDYRKTNKLSAQISKLSEKIDDIKFTEIEGIIGSSEYKYLCSYANNISLFLNDLCMSINAFTAEFKTIWVVDGRHKGSVDSIEDALKVLKHFLEKGLPSKYIRQNLWILLSPNLNNPNIAPAWGQSRTAYFSIDNKNVYKYAMNGFGLQSNNCEVKLTKAFEKYKEAPHLIAPITKNWGSYIIMQDRMKTGCTSNDEDAYKLKLKQFFRDHPEWKYDFSNDMHSGNIAYNNNGEIIGIDYGFVGDIIRGSI